MTALKKYQISFNPAGKTVDVLAGTSILDAARLSGINISAVCGGKGSCGKCRVIINQGNVSPVSENEVTLISSENIEKGHRLACSAFPQSNLKVDIPEVSMTDEFKLQLEGENPSVDADSPVKSYEVKIKPPSLREPASDLARVSDELKAGFGITDPSVDIYALKKLPALLRKESSETMVFMRQNEIIGFLPAGSSPAGIAVDLGTTKVAAYLMDLKSGKVIASAGAVNPQTAYGDDVMSRLDYSINQKKKPDTPYRSLSEVIRDLINDMTGKLVEETGITGEHVADMCIAGNTAMIHLFLDLPVEQLAKSPYVAAVDTSIDVKAREAGINICPGAYIHFLPGIGGFVGGDHTAMIIGSGIDRKKHITLGVDIGTNTEIVLHNPVKGTCRALSCPSGPAFEGAHVSDGMRAAKGAIESVRLTDREVLCKTIGDAEPIGMCGSGIIDTLAELYRLGLINARGRFDRDNPRIKQGEFGSEFVISEGGSGNGRIVITQKDIAEIQLAKGAIRAGIESLMEADGIDVNDVSEVILAGAFGTYINLVSAVEIGLFPAFPNAGYNQVGNSAGTGVRMALLSGKERKRAEEIALKIKYLELTTHKSFNQRFARGMSFPLEKQVADSID